MNEQIKKLAEQADPDYTGIYDDDMGHALVGEEAIKKFAELIIKETLQVARAGIEYGNGMEDAVYRYFGVEE